MGRPTSQAARNRAGTASTSSHAIRAIPWDASGVQGGVAARCGWAAVPVTDAPLRKLQRSRQQRQRAAHAIGTGKVGTPRTHDNL
eukprot:352544-Chlamydomonas_euryale.AAC.16